jgi:catechol 2,3-dioxygenase-like lactoylglutathione lyase family enzyme
MKRAWAAIAILGAAFFAVPVSADIVVRRTTLLVSDIDASIRFYGEMLGFSVWYDQANERKPGRGGGLPLDGEPGRSRLVIMKGKDPWIGMVALLAYTDPSLPRRAPPDARMQNGDAVLMMETNEIDAIAARLAKAGIALQRPLSQTEVTGAEGKKWQVKNLFVRDPDGRIIELSERVES